MINAELIEEEAISVGSLLALFQQAYFKTMITDDGDIIVETEGPRVLFEILPEVKMLKYMALYELDGKVPRHDMIDLANTMNDHAVLVRFCIPADTKFLIGTYHLSYDNGIAPYQIIATLRLFQKTLAYAINTYDTAGFVLRKD